MYTDNKGNLDVQRLADALINNRQSLGLSGPAPRDSVTLNYNGRDVRRAFEDGVKLYNFFRAQAKEYGCLRRDAALLDFGCGYGRFSQIARVDFAPEKIYSADISKDALALAREQGLDERNLIQLNAGQPVPVQAHQFDVIIVNSVFSHLSERSALFYMEDLARVLKPGGLLLVTVRSVSWVKYIMKLCELHRKGEEVPNLTLPLVKAFSAQLAAFDEQGDSYLFVSVGNSLGGDYGECFVPKKYIKEVWGKFFWQLRIHDAEVLGFDQSVIAFVK